MDLPVIDFHVHFPTNFQRGDNRRSETLRNYAKDQYEWMLQAWDFPPAEANPPEQAEQAERWRSEAERYGLARVVFVTSSSEEHSIELQRRYPEHFMAFSFVRPDEEQVVERVQRSITEGGLKGYKVIAPVVKRSFDDPELKPLWAFLQERRLPLLIHFGILGGGGGVSHSANINPLVIQNVAHEFPDLPIVIPHFGAGYWQELLHLGWSCPNVYVDTSGSNQWVRWMPYELTLEMLFRKAYETFGPKRIIFGSDSSFFPRGFAYRYLQDQVRICHLMNMHQEDMADIFYGNAARLLHLPEDPKLAFGSRL